MPKQISNLYEKELIFIKKCDHMSNIYKTKKLD
jgi:hypothetical protein